MKKKYYLLFLLLIPIIIIVGRSFALPISSEIKTIEINSDNYDNAGSFNIKKTVDWKEKGKAEITYTVKTIEKNTNNNFKDIVLVIDTSNSMNDGKLEKVRNDSIEFIRFLLNDLNNRVALITFNNTATIKSDFTNNKEELESLLNTLTISNKANFNNALLKVNELLNNYDDLDNHDLVVLFLTDGNPNEGMPNDKATYGMLKDKYQNIVINAVQYEEEKGITDGIKNISDNQFLVSDRNILTEAMLTSIPYEKFNIVDIINNSNFTINSIDDIKTNYGTVELKTENGNQVINWNLANTKSGVTSTMKVIINLNSNLINQNDLYKTNNGTTISYKLKEESEKSLTSDKTLLLKNKYNVNYDLNKPSNCNIDSISSESHFVGDIVSKKTQSLYCDGYIVKSWEIKGEDNISVKTINSSAFLMPSTDITVRAVWAKNGIVKSMDGVVYEKKNTLYRVLQDAAVDGTYAKEYKGQHMDSNTQVGNKRIYHWFADTRENDKGTAITNMYHVKFANHCWRMIRTTDTGGVKLLYNGEYDENKKCGEDRSHIQYSNYDYSTMTFSSASSFNYYSDYYYADEYRYDDELQKYVLINPEKISINFDNYLDLIGKYTCYSSNAKECTSIYRIVSEYNTSYSSGGLMLIYTKKPSYYPYSYYASQISSYASFNYNTTPVIGAGYMSGDIVNTYNTDFSYSHYYAKQSSESNIIQKNNRSYFNRGYYAESIKLDPTDPNGRYYVLENPVKITSATPASDLVGKYYASSTRDIMGWIDYMVDYDDNYVFFIEMDGWDEPYTKLNFGSSVTNNHDGTYTINDPVEMRPRDFANNYMAYLNMIFCSNGEVTCSHPRKITYLSSYSNTISGNYYWYVYYNYKDANEDLLVAKSRDGLQLVDTAIVNKTEFINGNNTNYSSEYNGEYKYTCGDESSLCTYDNLTLISNVEKSYDRITGYRFTSYFGSDVTWDGSKYTLVDPQEFDILGNNEELSKHHFFCLGERETSCEKVGYLISKSSYIIFENGNKDIDEVRKSMLEKNNHSSLAKLIIEEWFRSYMSKYQSYLEDVIWCNDRKALEEDSSWYKIDGDITHGYKIMADNYSKYEDMTQGYSYSYNYDYTLSLKCDAETDRFSVDNPKAHLEYPTALLTYNEMALLHNRNARVLPTSTYSLSTTSSGSNIIIVSDGRSYISGGYPISPAISLKYGTEYVSGTGTKDDPYVVDTSEVDGQ